MTRFLSAIAILSMYLNVVVTAQQAHFNELVHDFGEMKQSETRSTTFTLINTGSEVMHLAQPRASCGCTAVLLSQSELQPGDSAQIEVAFSSGPAMIGPVSKSIQVGRFLNGVERELATLRIKAEIVGIVRYDPGILEFRTVVGKEVSRIVRVRSEIDEVIRIRELEPILIMYADSSEGNTYQMDHVQAVQFEDLKIVPSSEEIPPHGEIFLELLFTLKNKGQLNGSVRVAFDRSEIRIPVVGIVLRSGP